MVMKKCKKCQCEKETTEYYNQKYYKDGLDPMCKECRNRTSEEYKQANLERLKEYRKQYHIENYDRIKDKRKEYYENNKEKHREYYRKRKEKENG